MRFHRPSRDLVIRQIRLYKDKKVPTIEMQPKDAGRGGDNTRVKVRYP